MNNNSDIHKNIIFKNILEFLCEKFNESKEKILYVLIENIYNLNVNCITGSLTPSHIYEQVDLKKLFNLINSSYPHLTDILSSFLFDIPTIKPTNNIKSFIQNGFVGPFKMKNYEDNEIKDYILNINKGEYYLLKNHHETNTRIQNLVNNKTIHDIVNEYIGYECACWNTEFFIRDNNDDFKYTSNWHIDTYFEMNEKYPQFTIQIGLTDNDINNSLKCVRGSHINDYQENYNKQNLSGPLGHAPLMLYDDSKINTDLIYNLLSTNGNLYLFSNYLTHGKGININNSSVRVGLTLRLISKYAVLTKFAYIADHISEKIFYLGSNKNNNTSENKTNNLIWQSIHNSFLNYKKKCKVIKNDFEQYYDEEPEVNDNKYFLLDNKKYVKNKNQLLNKKYVWENSNIEFLENGKMNAFGQGQYEFIDKYLVKCDFGGREHLLKFNGNYSSFFSVRKNDFEVVIGNHFHIILQMDSDLLRKQLNHYPPNTEYIKQILTAFKEGLFKFIPNKPDIHQFINDDLPLDTLDTPTVAAIVDRLIHWIEQFQAPIHDQVTTQWREDFKQTTNYTDFICQFVVEYKNHSEMVYKDTWGARKRIANNESAVPPEHRATGQNGVPDNMKSGRH